MYADAILTLAKVFLNYLPILKIFLDIALFLFYKRIKSIVDKISSSVSINNCLATIIDNAFSEVTKIIKLRFGYINSMAV